jgi:uncharacterized protein
MRVTDERSIHPAVSRTVRGSRRHVVARWRRWLALALCAMALAACGSGDETTSAKVDPAYQAEIDTWRKLRYEDLTRADGWLSIIGLHWLTLDAHFAGTERSGVDTMFGPPQLGMFSRVGERVYFTPERGVDVTHNGEPASGRIQLLDDRQPIPSILGYDNGQGEISVIWRGGRHALRIRHDQSEGRLKFAGIEYWPLDEGWKMQATFTPNPPGSTVEVVTVMGTTDVAAIPGHITFERDGKLHRLDVFPRGDAGYTVMFADQTSGQGSYGQGRFIDLYTPDEKGKLTIDFNRAYNPMCAYHRYGTCPTPPKTNRLELAVTAGEKRYSAHR